MHISTLDGAVIAVYVMGVVGLGLALRGRQQAMGDYFLGRGRIGWPLAMMSIVATETSTVTFLSVPGVAYTGNLTFLQLPLGYIVGRVAVAAFLMPGYFTGTPMTLYQTLRTRFGSLVQRWTSGLFVVTRTLADGLRLYLTAVVLHELVPWSFTSVVVVLGVATMAYTFLGGLRSVVWTDAIQLVVYMAGALIAGAIVLSRIDGGFPGMMAAADAAGKLQMFDWRWDLAVPFTFAAGVLGGAFISAASHGADQMMVQRYLATRSVRQARWALVTSSVVVLAQFAVFLLLGLALWAFYQGATFDSPDRVFARFIARELPVGLRGLIVAAALSAAMSTLSSSLNAVASAVMGDFVRAGHDERRALFLARGVTVVAGLAQVIVALVAQAQGAARSTVLAVITVAAFTTGLTLGALVLARLPRVGERAALVAMVAGAATVTCVWRFTDIAGPWYALVGTVTTVVAGAIASLVLRRGARTTAVS